MLKAVLPGHRNRAGSWRRTVGWTVGAVVLAVAMRVPFLSGVPSRDEGGMLLVARYWRSGGPQLYGHYFLDRPPLLELFWRLADDLGGVHAGRALATGGVVVLVVSAAWAGFLIGGHRGACWAAWVTAALAATPLLEVRIVNGELLGAPPIMLSCALTLTAARVRERPAVQTGCAFAAGLTAAAGLLCKQNLAGGIVFAAVLVLVAAATRRWPARRVLRILVPGLLGVTLPLLATVAWAATSRAGVRQLVYTLYGFRIDGARIIALHSDGTGARLSTLILAALVTGLVPLFLTYLWLARHRVKDQDPVTLATLGMLAVGVIGVALGANYWSHYLIALIPPAALTAAGLPALLRSRFRWGRRLVTAIVACSLTVVLIALSPLRVNSALHTATHLARGLVSVRSAGHATGSNTPHLSAAGTRLRHASPTGRGRQAALEKWLTKAHQPRDTALVTYGEADIIEGSNLRPSTYPYLWSLPVRVLDPHLTQLKTVVTSPARPTWIIEWSPFNTWGIDSNHALATDVRRHYHLVGNICGAPVYIQDGITRMLPSVPRPCLT